MAGRFVLAWKRRLSHSDTYTSATSTGTSIKGPITPARAWRELTPRR